jgi:hypothetical protein
VPTDLYLLGKLLRAPLGTMLALRKKDIIGVFAEARPGAAAANNLPLA